VKLAHASSNRTRLGTQRLKCWKKPEGKRKSSGSASYDDHTISKIPIAPYTAAKMIDELISELARANSYIKNQEDGVVRILPKYYFRAQEIMYRIPVYRPHSPIFEVDLKDLSCQLQSELADLKRSP
jgi:hypothetical protein